MIYFTDNGWSNATQSFRNTIGSGGGNEGLCKWTAIQAIPAGSIVRAYTDTPDYAWTITGSIPGTSIGTFGTLDLSQSGEQIYAFQAFDSNPLANPTVHLFVLDDTNGFEDPTSASSGNIPPGLRRLLTALTFGQSGGTQNFMAFNTGSLASVTAANATRVLQQIANGGQWTFGTSGTLPSGSITIATVNPTVTRTDADLAGATVNGVLGANEYGPGNSYSYSYTGGGTGFGGTLGNGVLYMNSDAFNLYIGFQPGGGVNDNAVVYLDTADCISSHWDQTMDDTSDGGRAALSDLTRDRLDYSRTLPEFALVFTNGGAGAALFDLEGPGLPHAFISTAGTVVSGAVTGNGFREAFIPLAQLGLGAGDAVDFHVAYCSATRFNSNETIPPMPGINGADNPGFGSVDVEYTGFNRFVITTGCTPPSISDQPDADLVCVGEGTTFAVTAAGSATLTYQWRRNGVALTETPPFSGVATPTLTVNPITLAEAGNYDVVVSNSCDSVTSAAAALTVQAPPSVNAGGDVTICAGGTVTLSGSASDAATTVWTTSGDGTFSDATSLTAVYTPGPGDIATELVMLTLTGQPVAPCVTPATDVLTVTIQIGKTITAQPDDVSQCVGGSASFSVLATGTAPITYQWRKDGAPLGGATSATLTISPVALSDAGSYDCVVTNGCGTQTSDAAILTVVAAPTPPKSAESDRSGFCADDSGNITLTAIGGSGTTLNWYTGSCGETLIGAGIMLTIPSPAVTTTYFARWSNDCGDSACASVTVTVASLPSAPSAASSSRSGFCADDAGDITLTATGGSGDSLSWYAGACGGTAIGVGAVLTIASPAVTTTYHARWEGSCGTSGCASVTVTVLPTATLTLDLQLSPTIVPGALTRCITVELWDSVGCSPPVTIAQEVFFSGGLASGVAIAIPCGTYDCITVRDRLHTLRRTASLTPVSGGYQASLVGTAALLGGNLDDSLFIDILDFGLYLRRFMTTYGSGSTTCATAPPHADFNGDGVVNTLDFGFIYNNFLAASEAGCCDPDGDSVERNTNAGPPAPVVSIKIAELRQRGWREAESLDLNGDGLLDWLDVEEFAAGKQP